MNTIATNSVRYLQPCPSQAGAGRLTAAPLVVLSALPEPLLTASVAAVHAVLPPSGWILMRRLAGPAAGTGQRRPQTGGPSSARGSSGHPAPEVARIQEHVRTFLESGAERRARDHAETAQAEPAAAASGAVASAKQLARQAAEERLREKAKRDISLAEADAFRILQDRLREVAIRKEKQLHDLATLGSDLEDKIAAMTALRNQVQIRLNNLRQQYDSLEASISDEYASTVEETRREILASLKTDIAQLDARRT